MFQRRNPLSWPHHVRQVIWPKMGWLRLVKYYRARIIRLSSSAESIAFNLAGGSAMSFTPFFGFHVLAALGFSWLVGVRMNVVAAMVGTFVGNPWTFPFLLYSSYRLGAWVLSVFTDFERGVGFNHTMVNEQSDNLMSFFLDNFATMFVPMSLGGLILAIISFPLYYYFYFYLVRGAQRARKLRMKRRQKKLFNKKSKGL